MNFVNDIIENVDVGRTTNSKFVSLARIMFKHTSCISFKVLVNTPNRENIREILCYKDKENQINLYNRDDPAIKSIILNCDHPRILDLNSAKYYISSDVDECVCDADCLYNKDQTCMLAKFFCYIQINFSQKIEDDELDKIDTINNFIKKFLFQSILDKKVVEQYKEIKKLRKEIDLSRSIRDELSKQSNLNASLMKFCNLLKQHLNLSKAEICLYKQNQIPIRVGIGFSKETMDMLNNSGILQRAMKKIQRNPEPYFVRDTTKTSKVINKKIAQFNDVKSYINYPLVHENEVIGHIHVARSFEQKSLNEYSMYLVGVMANAAIRAFRNAMQVEKIKNFNSTLEKEVDKATKDLIRANEQLKMLDELKSDFVNVVSHELRTPLTSIKGYIDLIFLSKNLDEFDPQVSDFLRIIKHEADRLSRLVNDMLDINKIESGKVDINKKEFTKDDLMSHLASLNFQIKCKGIKLNNNFNFDSINVDHDRFCQIVTNLITNAVKFSSEEGQIDFTIDKIDKKSNLYYQKLNHIFMKEFDPHSNNDDLKGFDNFEHFLNLTEKSEHQLGYEYYLSKVLRDYYLVSIKDYGDGIDEKNMGMLFNKFSQIPSKVRDAIGGTGLGLVITKYLVDLHGGQIFVDSKLNSHSEFFFFLPNKISKLDEK